MERMVLMQIDYQKWLAIPLADIGILERIKFVKEVGNAYEPIDPHEDGSDMKVVAAEKLSPEKVEESYKDKAEMFNRWWSEESAKTRKLEEELKKLKNGGPLVCGMGESPL